MSLYYEAAELIITLGTSQDSSLKSLLFSKTNPTLNQPRKSSPNQLYALITESWKWSSVLKDIIERAGLLSLERKLSPQLALVLVHDLLLSKKGVAAPDGHVLRKCVERHKARLKAEFTKARIRSGCASVEEWRLKLGQQEQSNGTDSVLKHDGIMEQNDAKWSHPRWLRINTLRTSTKDLLKDDFSGWQRVASLEELLSGRHLGSASDKRYHIDEDIPNLLALPPRTELSLIPAYKRGELISQDKASCFPAYLLSSGRGSGVFQYPILDACAAPGNKTSHIAAIMSEQTQEQESEIPHRSPQIYATERDLRRAEVLKKMLKIAGVEHVQVKAGQDFLKLDPRAYPWNQVSAIILDPSCSGSGIVERGQMMTFDLPSVTTPTVAENGATGTNKRKRKRKHKTPNDTPDTTIPAQSDAPAASLTISENYIEETESSQNPHALEARLSALAGLQTKMLTFAMTFPNARIITYSTCSIHDAENEDVVIAALASEAAMVGGWRVLTRSEQVDGMRRWDRRGKVEACRGAVEKLDRGAVESAEEIADACIRCEPFTREGTQGFFVAAFVRDVSVENGDRHGGRNGANKDEEEEEDEWGGFDE